MSQPRYQYDPAPRTGVSVDPTRDALARRLAAIVGTVFLVVGVLGFVPGVTENLRWAVGLPPRDARMVVA